MVLRTLAFPVLLAGVLSLATAPRHLPPRDPAPRREVRWGYAPAESLALVLTGERPSSNRPLMLLVPGPVGSAFSMRQIADALVQRGHAILIVDPLGMGTSTRPEGADYALSRQAERLRRMLDDVAPRGTPVLVAAIGTSATIALHLAAIDTARIRGVVSIAGGPVDRQGTKTLSLALKLAPLLDNRLGKSIARKRFESGARAQSMDDSWLTPEVLKAYVDPLERDIRGLFRALGWMQRAPEAHPIASRLPQIMAPVRLLVGDKVVPSAPTADQIALLTRLLPDFASDTVRGAGTMLHEEAPLAIVRALEALAATDRQRVRPAP